MKVTREWLASTNHCPEGHAWGDIMVGPSGLELPRCLELMERADWLLALLVKTQSMSLDDAMQCVRVMLRELIDKPEARGYIPVALDPAVLPAELKTLMDDASTAAYVASLNRDEKLAHQCSAVSFICKMQLADSDFSLKRDRVKKVGGCVEDAADYSELDDLAEKVLRYAQCVIVQLVNSKAGAMPDGEHFRAWHMKLCATLRERAGIKAAGAP